MIKFKFAGIVLYNPDVGRLRENIDAIVTQVDQLLLVENGSKSVSYLSGIDSNDKIVILRNDLNKGIAGALNQILQYAHERSYEWVLTLDQDSVVAPNIIQTYNQYTGQKDIGIVTCDIVDRNFSFSGRKEKGGDINFCISSGSYIRVNAWKQLGGFDEAMFIDSVDLDFCLSLRANCWRIFKTRETKVLHEVGNSKVIKIFGKEYLSLNHNILRYYYIVRNRVYVGRKHNIRFKSFKVIVRLFYTVLLYEHQRGAKIVNMLKGLIIGLTCKINRNDKGNSILDNNACI